jgi:hypothetical protein
MNICIFIILYDICLLPAQFCYVIIKYTVLGKLCEIRALRKFISGAENLVLQALQCQRCVLQRIPRRGKHKSLLIYLILYGGFV